MTAPAVTTRDRILDEALELMARNGYDGTSMRTLARAVDVNVAALYYHFPSKADLLRSLIDERRYDTMMDLVRVPPAGRATDRQRLTELLTVVWHGLREEERVWRVLLAESSRHNTDAQEVAADLVERFEQVALRWLTKEFEDLTVAPEVAVALVSDFLFANLVRLSIGAVDDVAVLARAAVLAAAVTR